MSGTESETVTVFFETCAAFWKFALLDSDQNQDCWHRQTYALLQNIRFDLYQLGLVNLGIIQAELY